VESLTAVEDSFCSSTPNLSSDRCRGKPRGERLTIRQTTPQLSSQEAKMLPFFQLFRPDDGGRRVPVRHLNWSFTARSICA